MAKQSPKAFRRDCLYIQIRCLVLRDERGIIETEKARIAVSGAGNYFCEKDILPEEAYRAKISERKKQSHDARHAMALRHAENRALCNFGVQDGIVKLGYVG